jgi:hypothetical protein
VGDNGNIYNKNCLNAYEDLELQKRKSKMKPSSQNTTARNNDAEGNQHLLAVQHPSTASNLYERRMEPPNQNDRGMHEEPIRFF